ncbi:hypothetical protein L6452_06120 [Arctium lappa]|uniref:Uncharacterized protein n=1 Tax=Arctium lappa TaxID=4217 RepID=A0ACB9EIY9_ARCLA|nr:hypothetical protein L6452_06120 [Arctium lappa]
MLKVSPWKGIIRFGKRGKLTPRFLGPFTTLEKIGLQAYILDLPLEMDGIHPTFHVCYLCKCLDEEESIIPLMEIQVENENRCVEKPEAILETKTKQFPHKEVTMVKVQWRNHRGANVTWESEEDMKNRYPHFAPIPTKKEDTLYTTSDDQTVVDLKVYQDANGILRVSTKELTSRNNAIKITGNGSLSKVEIEKMIQDGKRYKFEDEIYMMKVMAHQSLNKYACKLRTKIKSYKVQLMLRNMGLNVK